MDWVQELDGREVMTSAALLGTALGVGVLLALVAQVVLHAWSRRSGTVFDDLLARYTIGPLRLLIPLVLVLVALPAAELPPGPAAVLRQLVVIGCVAASTWL